MVRKGEELQVEGEKKFGLYYFSEQVFCVHKKSSFLRLPLPVLAFFFYIGLLSFTKCCYF